MSKKKELTKKDLEALANHLGINVQDIHKIQVFTKHSKSDLKGILETSDEAKENFFISHQVCPCPDNPEIWSSACCNLSL